jgi:hypothetical protein
MELLIYEVTEDNYQQFLTYHGRTVSCAQYVVDTHDKTDNYYKLKSVYLWVEASKMVIKLNG